MIFPFIEIVKNDQWLELAGWLPFLAWLAGTMLGYLVLQLDQLLDIFVTNPQTNLALTVKSYLKKYHIQYALRLLEANKHLQPRLTFRSISFQLIWIALAVFTMTSTGSVFSKGFVLGLGIRLLLEQWHYFLVNKNLLSQWLFWQVKRQFTQDEVRWYLLAMTGLTLLMIIGVKI